MILRVSNDQKSVISINSVLTFSFLLLWHNYAGSGGFTWISGLFVNYEVSLYNLLEILPNARHQI